MRIAPAPFRERRVHNQAPGSAARDRRLPGRQGGFFKVDERHIPDPIAGTEGIQPAAGRRFPRHNFFLFGP
jgi:hypothetical protein